MGLTPMTLAGVLLPPALVTYFIWAHRRLSGVICESPNLALTSFSICCKPTRL